MAEGSRSQEKAADAGNRSAPAKGNCEINLIPASGKVRKKGTEVTPVRWHLYGRSHGGREDPIGASRGCVRVRDFQLGRYEGRLVTEGRQRRR